MLGAELETNGDLTGWLQSAQLKLGRDDWKVFSLYCVRRCRILHYLWIIEDGASFLQSLPGLFLSTTVSC